MGGSGIQDFKNMYMHMHMCVYVYIHACVCTSLYNRIYFLVLSTEGVISKPGTQVSVSNTIAH